MNGVEIARVPTALVQAAWPDMAPWLAPAIERACGRHTMATTLERLANADMLAVVALRDARPIMACILQVALYPAQKWLQVPFCGGRDMADWLEPLLDEIDSLAYEYQCVGVEISGRGGWQRVLRDYGYRLETDGNLLVKRLDEPMAVRRAAE